MQSSARENGYNSAYVKRTYRSAYLERTTTYSGRAEEVIPEAEEFRAPVHDHLFKFRACRTCDPLR